MRLLPPTAALVAPVLFSAVCASPALAQRPSVDMANLLKAVEFWPRHPDANDKGLVTFHEAAFAFLPAEAVYDANDHNRVLTPLELVVRAGGEERLRHPIVPQAGNGVFSSARSHTGPTRVPLDQAGTWELSLELASEPIARLPFEVELRQTGDAFDPATETHVSGPFANFGYFEQPESGDPTKPVTFHHWIRGGPFNATGADEPLRMDIVHEGRVVYTSTPKVIGNEDQDAKWFDREYQVKLKESDGSGPVLLADMTRTDGQFAVVIERAGEVSQVFPYEVAGGRFVPHARSAFDYEPRTDFLISRGIKAQFSEPHDMLWMEAVPEGRWAEFIARGPVAAAGPDAATLERWSRPPASGGAFSLNVTPADARMDAALAAGDGVIAFGTGGYNGVSWMRVGDTERRSLPGGTEFSAYGLAVAGKKIVLWRGNQLCVFDTETETLHEIPEDVVHLMKPSHKPFGPSFFAVDGMLVATLNDPNKVTDRRMVKVVDLSGPEPVVIALQNPEIEGRELNCIGVDAETGVVAATSQRKARMFYGPIVADTDLGVLDLSGTDGISDNCVPQLTGGRIVYFDDSGSSPRVRVLDPESGQFRAFGSLRIETNTLHATPGGLAMTSEDSSGSMYRILSGPLDGPLAEAANVGESGPGGGAMGLGAALAIAPDGTLFTAGQGAGGVGSGEFLQVLEGGAWRVLLGPDGEALQAVDLALGRGLLAFKTGSRNDTKIGYLTFGSTVDLSGAPFWTAE